MAPPGASSAVPGVERVAAGGLADRAAARRGPGASASEAVKPAGMCWTISVPAPRRRGQRGSSSAERARAAGGAGDRRPRAALPAARRRRGAAAAVRGAARRGVAVAARGAARRAAAAWRTLLGELGGEGVERLADRRLGDEVEGALGQRVDRAGAVGGREGARRRRPARRRAARRCSARSTPMPSRPGMARSSVMASGRVRAAQRERLVAVARRCPRPRSPAALERAAEERRMKRRVVGDDDRGWGGAAIGVGLGGELSAAERANSPAGLSRTTGGRRSWRWRRSRPRRRSGRRSSWSASTVRTSSTSSTTTPA